MCGIFVFLSHKKYDVKCLLAEFYKLAHRGPDNYKCQVSCRGSDNSDQAIFFVGFHRLAIIDQNRVSDQPFTSNNVHLVCNGEIYNYKQLIIDHKLSTTTNSDCEVILLLYIKYGIEETIRLLDGEFAFVLVDENTQKIYAGRDIFGVRPLFFGKSDSIVVFASEAKSLINTVEHVEPFIPGTFMEIDSEALGQEKTKKYYLFPNVNIIDNKSLITKNINTLLTEAIHKRLQSDRPLGTLLSGGLDSSIVTSVVSRQVKNLHCFSIGLDDSYDIIAAKKVAEYLNINNHHVIHFTIQEGIEALEDVIYTLETYDVTTIRASIPQYLMGKYISNNTNIKVLLSGEGSDELFGGYKYSRDAPSEYELLEDSKRLLSELYMYDNLRTDRTMARWGLEVRVPFLDKNFVNYVLTMDPKAKMQNSLEKLILRESFEENYLPKEILYRSKAAFSDAVSSKSVTWYKELIKHIENLISDDDFNRNTYLHNPPLTKEGMYYRQIFDKYFPNGSKFINKYWMPKWQNKTITDPSATVL